MTSKQPLYFKRSKAANQLELDFDVESEQILRKHKKGFGRSIKPHNKESSYKRSFSSPYYRDSYKEHKYKYNDLSFESDSSHDTEKTQYESGSGSNSNPSETELIPKKSYKKERNSKVINKKELDTLQYNHNKAHKKNNSSTQKRKFMIENGGFINGGDYNVYISPQPITLQYQSQIGLKKPKTKSSKAKEKTVFRIPPKESKPLGDYEVKDKTMKNSLPKTSFDQQQQGDSPKIYSALTESQLNNIQQITGDVSANIANGTTQLFYLPVYVQNNNKIGVLPGAFANNTDAMGNSSYLMAVYPSLSMDQSNVFEHKTNKLNNETRCSKTGQTNDRMNKQSTSKTNQQEDVKEKLYDSRLETAMSVKSYESLIAAHPVPKSTPAGALLSLIRVSKEFKRKKSSIPLTAIENHEDKSEAHRDAKKTRSQSIKDQILEIEKNKIKNERKNTLMNTISVDGQPCKNKASKEKCKNVPNMNLNVEQIDDGQNIIINITNNSPENNGLSNNSQYKRVSPIMTGKDQTEEISSTSCNTSNNLGDNYNSDVSQKQEMANRKPSLVSRIFSVASQDKKIPGNSQIPVSSQNNLNLYQSFTPSEEVEECITGEISGIIHEDSEFYENSYRMGTDYTTMQPQEEFKNPSPRQNDVEVFFVANNNKYSTDILVDDINKNSEKNIQNRKKKELLSNTKSKFKREILKRVKIPKDKKDKGESQSNNKVCEENANGSQEVSKHIMKMQTSNIPIETQPFKKSLVLKYDDNIKEDELKAVPTCSNDLHFEDVNNFQSQPDLDNLSANAREENPPLEVIYPPPEKSLHLLSANNSQQFEMNESEKTLLEESSTVLQHSQTVIKIGFQAATYILGATSFDKLINLAEMFYSEDI